MNHSSYQQSPAGDDKDAAAGSVGEASTVSLHVVAAKDGLRMLSTSSCLIGPTQISCSPEAEADVCCNMFPPMGGALWRAPSVVLNRRPHGCLRCFLMIFEYTLFHSFDPETFPNSNYMYLFRKKSNKQVRWFSFACSKLSLLDS